MTINYLVDQLIYYPIYVYGIIIIVIIVFLIIVGLTMMEARCPDLINCTQSMANALVEGITNSFSSFECKSMNELTPSNDPVWILGEKYSSLHDMDGIKDDIRSKFWISYRRGFPRIDGTGPTTDFGWGCMLRCGQMVLSQALIVKHLGRHWRWSNDKNNLISNGTYKKYLKILSHFLDRKASTYSIHQIAQMGATEGKPVGTWFGPNTICQVIKKLAAFDKWDKYAVHVCTDSLVIIDDIKQTVRESIDENEQSDGKNWVDLILFIPVRLGLSEVNPGYFDGIKNSFRLPQSLGIIGGRPNHALHFIGYVGNELIYFDPHTTQSVVDPEPLVDIDGKTEIDLVNIDFDDSSYHTENAFRMTLSQLDPSLALCFYFHSEEDFDSWCNLAHNLFIKNVPMLIFEIFKEKPYGSLKLSSQLSQEDYDTGTINITEKGAEATEDNDGEEEEEFEILSTE